MEYSNKNLTFAGIGVIALSLIWFFVFGANTSYLRGALINDLECGEVDGYQTVFAREALYNPTSSNFRPSENQGGLDEVFNSSNEQELQVRIFNDSQSCDQQTIVRCDSKEIIPYEESTIYICRDFKDDESTYFLGGSDIDEISDFAYYLQDLNLESDSSTFDDAVYTNTTTNEGLNLVNISNYQVLVQQR